VVAGAREMMRYRRNRASTMEGGSNGGAPAQQMPMSGGNVPSQYSAVGSAKGSTGWSGDVNAGGSAAGTPWAVYQNSGKVGNPPQMQVNQQSQQVPAGAAQPRKVIDLLFTSYHVNSMYMFLPLDYACWSC
jgi:hypothetical protein